MHQDTLKKLLERRVKLTRQVLLRKQDEYATVDDVLHNFKAAAEFQGVSVPQALWGMAAKHLISISDLVRKGKKMPQAVRDEKIGDAINYLILLEAAFCVLQIAPD